MKRCSKCREMKSAGAFYVERSGRLKSQCKECARESKRAWKAANKEKDREHWVRWRAKQAAGTLPYQRAWYERQDPEDELRKRLEWKRANPERTRELNRKSYHRNLERSRARSRAQAQRRRTQAVGSIPVEVVEALVQEPCAYCGSTQDIEIDHIIPLARGGTHIIENLAPACRPCNRSKGAKLVSEWKVAA